MVQSECVDEALSQVHSSRLWNGESHHNVLEWMVDLPARVINTRHVEMEDSARLFSVRCLRAKERGAVRKAKMAVNICSCQTKALTVNVPFAID